MKYIKKIFETYEFKAEDEFLALEDICKEYGIYYKIDDNKLLIRLDNAKKIVIDTPSKINNIIKQYNIKLSIFSEVERLIDKLENDYKLNYSCVIDYNEILIQVIKTDIKDIKLEDSIKFYTNTETDYKLEINQNLLSVYLKQKYNLDIKSFDQEHYYNDRIEENMYKLYISLNDESLKFSNKQLESICKKITQEISNIESEDESDEEDYLGQKRELGDFVDSQFYMEYGKAFEIVFQKTSIELE